MHPTKIDRSLHSCQTGTIVLAYGDVEFLMDAFIFCKGMECPTYNGMALHGAGPTR